MIYKLILAEKVEKDLKIHAKSGNKILLKKIYLLFEEIISHPKFGTGKPEQLKHDLNNHWSRRIDSRHRLIYQIKEEEVIVEVISALGHYQDK